MFFEMELAVCNSSAKRLLDKGFLAAYNQQTLWMWQGTGDAMGRVEG